MSITNVYRDGRLHVCAHRCDTCIGGRNSPVSVERRTKLAADALTDNEAGSITCHHTLVDDVDQAVCRWFWDAHRSEVALLTLAEHLGIVEYDTPTRWLP